MPYHWTITANLLQHTVMNRCSRCSSLTQNPKFCSRSCSATSRNIERGLRNKRPCEWCSSLTINQRFCSLICNNAAKKKDSEAKAKQGNGGRLAIRRILMREQNSSCKICKNDSWLGLPIPLELDHINGNPDDWSMINLRLICPNCHAQTPTFRAKNKGKGRAARRARYALTGFS